MMHIYLFNGESGEACECVNCIHLAQVRDQWRTVVNTVITLRFP
jgi:hypothetical protein